MFLFHDLTHSPVTHHVSLSLLFLPRTVQSLIWCSKTLLTSGLLVQQGRSAPSSRFFTTPASATAQRGNQISWTVSPNCWEVRQFEKNTANCPLVIFLLRTQWLWYARLTAVILCCKPVWIWLFMMTTSTWCVWKCMLLPHTQHLLSALLKWGQWGCPT